MNTHESNLNLTATIVSKYVGHHKLATSQISELITTVQQAIIRLSQAAEPEEIRTPAVSIRRSVQQNHVVCLDCGSKAVTLRRHLKVRHSLTPDEYRQRWGLKKDHPLTAPAYSERRSTAAKAIGFGRKPSLEAGRTQIVAAPPMPIAVEPENRPAPEGKSRARRATRPANVVNDPPSESTPPKGRRTRSRARDAAQP
jgi:predicted transcriptional regulator